MFLGLGEPMSKNRKKEAELSRDLVMSLHLRDNGDKVAKINEGLQKYNDTSPSNLMTVMLREAIILDLGGSAENFTNFWFMKTVQSTIKKFESYGCTWALVAGCITAVLGFSEIASVIPRNIGSYISAMIVSNLIDNATKDEEAYRNILNNLLEMGIKELDSQELLYKK